MKKLTTQIASAALLVCGFALQATAAPIVGSSSCTFENPVGPGGMVTTGAGTSSFSWGVGAPPSSLTCAGNGFNTTTNAYFDVGTVTYFNGAINAGTQADSVDLAVSLNFTDPAGISETFTYLLSLINTPNTGTPQEAADIVQFPGGLPAQSFNIAGTLYTLALEVGTATAGGFTTQDTFSVIEGGTATATLRGRVTAAQVSEPGTLALLGLGLVGIGMIRRRRHAA